MDTDLTETKLQIQKLLNQEVTHLSLKAAGYCNNAYYVETESGGKYIVKQEKARREIEEQNTLPVEARLIQRLSALSLSIALPRIVFISEVPVMIGYEYIEGEPLIAAWAGLEERERIGICRSLGKFHAEIGDKFSKDDAIASDLKLDESVGLHPEVAKEYEAILGRTDVPEGWKDLARQAKAIFDQTVGQTVFQFIHNDAHHENVLIKDKKIAGIIDFGDAEYGEMASEFSRYIRDYPHYFEHIAVAYEQASGHNLSRARLISHSFLAGLIDNVEDYMKGGASRSQAERAVSTYRTLLRSLM